MAIQVLTKEEMNEVSGGLLVQVGANAATPILALDLNLGNLFATISAVAGLALSTVTGLLGTLLGAVVGLV
jgi:bacteriocin-like protein